MDSQVNREEISGSKRDKEAFNFFIKCLEEYLYYNYIELPETFEHVLYAIESQLITITVLPENQMGIYGVTYTQSIQITPNLQGRRGLTSEERTRLYVTHELGNIINCCWNDEAKMYANMQKNKGILSAEQRDLFCEGFAMLDEAITQNRAENFAYTFSHKQRPGLSYQIIDRRLFNGERYRTNFDFYGELQKPATMFARTLRGIGK